MLILFGLTIFVGAALLFLVQPMFARMALPLLGGAPAVWNTALVFYQAALLGGYAYAHATTTWLGPRRQAALQLAVLLLPLAVLPIGIPSGWAPPGRDNPIPWLLLLLTVSVGLPFFAVSTTSPLVQRWFAGTRHGAAADPYFLYAASNLGSLLALLAYPSVVEPTLELRIQSRLWAIGYGLLVCLTAGCAVMLWRAPARAAPEDRAAPNAGPAPAALTAGRRLRWVACSLVPSSLMMSVTTFLSTDIAAIPLLWVIPLALYLLTFVIVFARCPAVPHRLVIEALPFVMLPLVLVLAARANEPLALVLGTHLVAFFAAALACHGELAADRPPARHLTTFYLWMSVGGVLGGVFTALVAPLVFTAVVEYPLMLVLACLLPSRGPVAPSTPRARLLDLLLPAALGLSAAFLIRTVEARSAGPAAGMGLVFGGLTMVCLLFVRRPVRFGLGLGALLAAGALYHGQEGRVLHAERSFFGVHRVTLDPTARYHVLLHGTTLHGMQSLDPARRREPLTYFHATGPLGQLFAAHGTGAPHPVAVVGLGAGSIGCHGASGERWTFYEIDPAVERIARDTRYFSFLRDCRPEASVVLGDARRSLAAAPAGAYGLIILDAYSSDAPPVHLITREALRLYLAKLRPDGLLVFNVSNRHLDLEPVLGRLAGDAGLVALVQDDADVTPAERAQGKLSSQWVVMARHPASMARLGEGGRWRSARPEPGRVWTDDFSSLMSAFRWR